MSNTLFETLHIAAVLTWTTLCLCRQVQNADAVT